MLADFELTKEKYSEDGNICVISQLIPLQGLAKGPRSVCESHNKLVHGVSSL